MRIFLTALAIILCIPVAEGRDRFAEPGSMYAALEREGEACSRWSETAGKHYTDATLVAIDCGSGWECACLCAD